MNNQMSLYSKYNDTELVLLIREGNADAFAEIYNRHWEELLRSAYRILREKDACMDVLQEVFVWYWTHRDSLILNSVKAYLHVAVKFQVANYIRRAKVRDRYVQKTELLQLEESHDENLLELKEFKAMLAGFTADLPDRCREVFHLSRNEHFSNKEIASKLGISEKTVEMQITIALKRLRLQIDKHSAFLFFFL
jgi:RNA polymerase sigma-70 factor (ECF subfamily)